MTNLEIALLITGQGMLGIFAVMGLITTTVLVLQSWRSNGPNVLSQQGLSGIKYPHPIRKSPRLFRIGRGVFLQKNGGAKESLLRRGMLYHCRFLCFIGKKMYSCYITAARASISSHHTSNTLLAVGSSSAKCASKCCLFKR